MRRDLGLVLLLLLWAIVAPVAGTTLHSSPGGSQPSPARSVEILELEGDTRTTITRQSIDVSTAVASQAASARTRLDRHALEVEFERTEGEQPRRELLFEAATAVEIDVSELRVEQRALRARYVAGELSTETFLRRQTVIRTRAEQLRLDLDAIRALADEVPRLSMDSRLASLRAALTGLDGPVAARTQSAVSGEAPPVRLSVAVSTNGTTLSMIDDGEYVRESFRSDLWTPDTSSGIPLDDVEVLAGELYTVAFNPPQVSSRGIANVGTDRAVDTGIYRIDIVYQQGQVVAYLDGDTERVFYEIQRQPLDQIASEPALTTAANDTRLAVNRTFRGGPLRVSVVDNRTGDPEDAEVHVGDVQLGTGSDGVAWTLMPAEPVRVTAVTDRGNVSLLVPPIESTAGAETPSTADAGRLETATVAGASRDEG